MLSKKSLRVDPSREWGIFLKKPGNAENKVKPGKYRNYSAMSRFHPERVKLYKFDTNSILNKLSRKHSRVQNFLKICED